MAGELRDGERIPRRPLPEFSEAGSMGAALKRDGLMKTALGDTNEYGPHSMMLLLMIVATSPAEYFLHSDIFDELVNQNFFFEIKGNIQTLHN